MQRCDIISFDESFAEPGPARPPKKRPSSSDDAPRPSPSLSRTDDQFIQDANVVRLAGLICGPRSGLRRPSSASASARSGSTPARSARSAMPTPARRSASSLPMASSSRSPSPCTRGPAPVPSTSPAATVATVAPVSARVPPMPVCPSTSSPDSERGYLWWRGCHGIAADTSTTGRFFGCAANGSSAVFS